MCVFPINLCANTESQYQARDLFQIAIISRQFSPHAVSRWSIHPSSGPMSVLSVQNIRRQHRDAYADDHCSAVKACHPRHGGVLSIILRCPRTCPCVQTRKYINTTCGCQNTKKSHPINARHGKERHKKITIRCKIQNFLDHLRC